MENIINIAEIEDANERTNFFSGSVKLYNIINMEEMYQSEGIKINWSSAVLR